MSTFNNPEIRRLEDGSIDYAYYVRLGHEARSREVKIVSNRVFGLPSSILKLRPVAAAIVCRLPAGAGSIAQDDTSGQLASLDQCQRLR